MPSVQLRAQCTDHWTTGQSHGIGMPVVQLTTHVKSSTLYGRKVVWLYGRMVIRSYGHTVIQWYGRMVVWAYGCTTKFFWLDGLLLFCIIMGLRSASSAINYIFSCEWIRNLQNDPHKKLRLKKKHKKKVRHGQGSNYHVTGTSWILIKAWRRLLSQ